MALARHSQARKFKKQAVCYAKWGLKRTSPNTHLLAQAFTHSHHHPGGS
jgi:hypothetical protein